MEINRRSFLTGAMAAAGAAAASGLTLPQAVQASSGRELATMLDLSKCIGCESCVEACREVNKKYMRDPIKPIPRMFPERVKIEDWSEKKNVTDRLTPYNWLYVENLEVKKDGEDLTVNIPRRCMHCQNPPCANLCPWGAANKQDNGLTVIDPDICLGGAKCQQVCPWNIPQRQSGVGLYLSIAPAYAGNGVMFKCHRCHERLDKGELPACVEVCPEKVQTIGPRERIIAQAHARAKEIGGYIYGEHENGGTNTIYVSPVPFEQLNQALRAKIGRIVEAEVKGAVKAKGLPSAPEELKKAIAKRERDGRPHFKPVGNSMAQAENLTLALVVAPIAGVAAALHKARKMISRLSPGSEDRKEDNGNV
ncbi:MAG: 4Fe-4S dicluster domain-containing protein [Thermodesulfobacteriota bacterium]